MSYQDELDKLEARKCGICGGTGKLNDAELGDISYNEWGCDDCKGTGLKPDEARLVSEK